MAAVLPGPKEPSTTPVNATPSASRATSVGASSSNENRKARRKNKKRKEKADAQPEAGPSNPKGANTKDLQDAKPSSAPGPSTTQNNGSQSFLEADFIAFDDEPESQEDEPEALDTKGKGKQRAGSPSVNGKEPYAREWDKGKGRMLANDDRSHGRKRKVDEVDLRDGYDNKKQRLDAASRRAPWVWDVDWDSCRNVAEMLHREVDSFIQYISPTPIEEELRTLTVELIRNAITEDFPDAQVLPFGSYETKLYLPLGDIDLVVLSNSMAYSRTANVLRAIAHTIKRAGIADKVTIIDKAKVPIVKFVTSHGRFAVDISINQQNGVAAGTIIKHFLRELPALRPLVLIIKSFLAQRSMNEVYTGGLGSFSIVCLAISFLQMHPKVRQGEIDPMKNLGVLVMEFFELYGCYFNYEEVGISLRNGGTYYNKQRRGWLDWRARSLLSIEDPGDPSNDISRGTYNILKVRTTFAGAHGMMTAAAYTRASLMNVHRGRHDSRYRHDDPEDLSILARVMGVTQETVNHRKVVQEVYDSRVLHRMLGVQPAVPVFVDAKQPKDEKKPKGNSNKPMPETLSHEAKESVKSAWKETEAEQSFDHSIAQHDDEEEESRYGIANVRDSQQGQPPSKRRRTGKSQDEHTIFTSDASEDESDGHPDADVSASPVVHLGDVRVGPDDHDAHAATSEEEAEYDVDGDRPEKDSGSEKRERTRSFWLSKGGVDMGI